ncbi:PREDICTED: dual specificity protein phosphatase 12-like isoform X2 [Priapulus caudatus]|uniref:protein-tyrosine-phosphatase n=1 Tax=Priapulus caudatus TaxID=37621 RepID=A0ABM1DWJ7_PRICU|nr:PREDICTED: dual specificity protein phosphatase 12-like isoform X2 [Priapulus caudatus]
MSYEDNVNVYKLLQSVQGDMHEVAEKLFLGSLIAAKNWMELKRNGITHILSVMDVPLPRTHTQGFTYKFVKSMDMADADLLSYFDECHNFIEDGCESGGILVHCLVGVSRSATLVIAHLMKKEAVTMEKALAKVRQIRFVSPNPGFKHQLKVYESCGCHMDEDCMEFRKLRLSKLSPIMQEPGDKILPESVLAIDPINKSGRDVCLYKCKKCRRSLFCESSIISHFRGYWAPVPDWKLKLRLVKMPAESAEPATEGKECLDSIHVEPVQWMADVILSPVGKIHCPKCSFKIGSFNWAGEHCSCGTWVTPSICMDKKKVDKCQPLVSPVTTAQSKEHTPSQDTQLPTTLPIGDKPLSSTTRSKN